MNAALTRRRTSKERRYSLPAKVNVMVISGHTNQLSDPFAHRKPSQPGARKNTAPSAPTKLDQQELLVATESRGSLPHSSAQYLSLTAIPEDIEDKSDGSETDQELLYNQDDIVLTDPAPDGGYGWVIVLASFMCNLVVDGIAYTFGLFFNDFVTEFKASKGKTALVGSLLSGCYLSAGPIVSALTNRFGCRNVTIFGSVISCVAFLLSSIAPNINVLLLTYGIMGGIGFGLVYLPAIVSVGYYFTTKRAFATGIAVCGSGVGAFLFAPFTQYLLSIYHWKGALVIIAGLALNCAVFGALMRPLNVEAETIEDDDEDEEEEEVEERLDEAAAALKSLVENKQPPEKVAPESEPSNGVFKLEPLSKDDIRKISREEPFPTSDFARVESFSGDKGEEERATLLQKLRDNSHSEANDAYKLNKLQDSAISLSEGMSDSITALPNKLRATSAEATTGRRANSIVPGAGPQAAGIGRYAGKRTVSECYPPPLHVILSSGSAASRRGSLGLTQSIMVRPLCKKDIFFSGSTLYLQKATSVPRIGQNENLGASIISIPKKDVIDRVQRDSQWDFKELEKIDGTSKDAPRRRNRLMSKIKKVSKCPKSILSNSILKEMLNFSLLKESPAFAMLALSNVFGFMGFYIPFVYIIQHVRTQVIDGDDFVSKEKAALLLSVIGITNTIGRIILGYVCDKATNPESGKPSRITALLINNVCLFLSGITVITIPFLPTYTLILINCTFFGLFVSAYICLTSIILVDLLGLDKLTNAFGLLSMFRGGASMLGPPLAGVIYDFTDSFDLTFYAAGILLILSGLVSSLIPRTSSKNYKCKA